MKEKKTKLAKPIRLKTKRLRIEMMSDAEIEELIAQTTDEEELKAYREMYDKASSNPTDRIWYAPWKICDKKTGKMYGDLCFKGPQQLCGVEVGYGIKEEYQGQGYATEALKEICSWAFSNENVYFVEAETDPDNKASQRVLEKAGFKANGKMGEEGPRYEIEAPSTSWTAIYMLFGLSIGMAIGVSSDNNAIGMSIGMCIGLALGAALDTKQRKDRIEIRGKRAEAGK